MVYRKFLKALLASNSSYETYLAASLKNGVWKVLMANCSCQYLLYEVFKYFNVSKLSQTSHYVPDQAHSEATPGYSYPLIFTC